MVAARAGFGRLARGRASQHARRVRHPFPTLERPVIFGSWYETGGLKGRRSRRGSDVPPHPSGRFVSSLLIHVLALGAPVKRASTRVEVPPVQLDGSAPQTVPTASPRGGVGSRHGVEPAGRNAQMNHINEPRKTLPAAEPLKSGRRPQSRDPDQPSWVLTMDRRGLRGRHVAK